MAADLKGRKLYIPRMSHEGAACMAAVFQSIGVDAQPSPPGDDRTLELAKAYLAGDECLPQAIVLGNFLKVAEQPDYDPQKTAFMLPTSNGPCRFGHYLPLVRKIFKERQEDVLLFAPTSTDGYSSISENAMDFIRTAWPAVLASDILRKMLLITRPYANRPEDADAVYDTRLPKICNAIAQSGVSHKQRLQDIRKELIGMRDAFRNVAGDRTQEKVVIGVVGEIFCRHNNFSNHDIFRLIEAQGGVVWISDIAEWVLYTSDEEVVRLVDQKRQFSLDMLKVQLKQAIMRADEKKLMQPFRDDFRNFQEPHHVRQVLNLASPYLPRDGSNGEMVMSTGKALWYYQQGAAGIIDISPFTCMNGIITEAVYPRISRDFGGFPIRVFYFDGNQPALQGDLEIFIELAKNYQRNQLRQTAR